MDEYFKLEKWMQAGIEALSPASRRILLHRISIDVRKYNQVNITKQQNPDGTRWEARKRTQAKSGQIKNKIKMMMGLRQARRMRINVNADGAAIGFTGRNAQIASVHHTGSIGYVSKEGPKVKYPVRQLLGFSPEMLDIIEDRVIDHLIGSME